MSGLNLSPEARRRLWRCYLLVLRQKSEDQNTVDTNPDQKPLTDIENIGLLSSRPDTAPGGVSEEQSRVSDVTT